MAINIKSSFKTDRYAIVRLVLCATVFAGFSKEAMVQPEFESLQSMDVDELLSELALNEFIMEEIVVTATRREAEAPETPISDLVIRTPEFELS